MPFKRPTLKELVSQLQTDFATRLTGADTQLRRSVLAVMSRVIGGGMHLVYGFISWVARQILPDVAESGWLARHGGIWGVTRKAASYARGQASFDAPAGSVIPAGALVKRSDGAEYVVEADAVAAGGAAVASVRAVTPGVAGNADAGVAMSLVQPASGVSSSGVVATEISGGADAEGDEALRGRIVKRIQEPPHGGCGYDWVAWTLEVSGVTRAWVRPLWMGLGTVGVLFVCDDQEDIIPDAETVARVQDHLTAFDRKPVTADVYVVAPMAVALDFEIAGLTPATVAVMDQVAAELRDLIRREAAPGGTILVSHIREAISVAVGEHDHVLVSPAANVTHQQHEIAIMGAITWS